MRVTLGLNIALHGIVRIAPGPTLFADHLVHDFGATILPASLVHAFGLALPFIEAVLGLLILCGALLRVALTGGALLMTVLVFGTALRSQWDVATQQMIYAGIYFLLLTNIDSDAYSLNGWRGHRRW